MLNPSNRVWYSGDGDPHAFVDVLEKIKELKGANPELEVHVGTDSDPNGKKYAIATGIGILFPGRGGIYFWTRDYMDPKKTPSMGQRLELEVTHSISVADTLKKLLDISVDIIIHVDCSTNPKHASTKHLKRLKNFALGMNYKVIVKPDSWAASCLADRHAKSSSLPRNK